MRRMQFVILIALAGFGAASGAVFYSGGAFANGPSGVSAVSLVRGARLATLSRRSDRGISSTLRRDFAIFKRAQAADASTPTVPTGVISPNAAAEYGLDLADAQYVQASRANVWVVPGASGACIVSEYGSATATQEVVAHCDSVADVTTYGLTNGLQRSGGGHAAAEYVSALIPNGNGHVTIHDAGASASMTTTDNVITAAVPVGDVTITAETASGPVTFTKQFQ